MDKVDRIRNNADIMVETFAAHIVSNYRMNVENGVPKSEEVKRMVKYLRNLTNIVENKFAKESENDVA
jgi:hypothetical protein